MKDEAARSERTGWVAYVTVMTRADSRSTFAVVKVPLPADVSSLAAATATAERIVTTEYGGEARVQGLFEWDGGYLWPRWMASRVRSERPDDGEGWE
jgi:hypothetical protein